MQRSMFLLEQLQGGHNAVRQHATILQKGNAFHHGTTAFHVGIIRD